MKDDLLRLKDGVLSEMITPKHLHSLQTQLTHAGVPPQLSPRAALHTPPPQPIKVTPFTLWQDLHEVKASGLLGSLTAREIRLQEVCKESLML